MNTCKNATRGGGALASKKLLAALAVLAVALVMLAAVPAVSVDGEDIPPADSGDNTTLTKGEDGYYHISTADELFIFADMVNKQGIGFSGETVVLDKDIDLESKVWTPVGQTEAPKDSDNWNGTHFQGTFDGQSHTISNLKVTTDSYYEYASTKGSYAAGLFGFINEPKSVIKNLVLDNADISAYHYAGAVAGYTSGTIENCVVKNSTVTSTHKDSDACGDKAGAVLGFADGTHAAVVNCSAENCKVYAARDAGQVIGCTEKGTKVSGLSATADVTVAVVNGSTCDNSNKGANIRNEPIGRDLGSVETGGYIEDSEGNKTYLEKDSEIQAKENMTIKGDVEFKSFEISGGVTVTVKGSPKGDFTLQGKDASVKFQKDETYSGKISFGEVDYVVFNNVKFTSDTTVTAGSVEIEGSFTSTAGGSIVVYGEAKITGNTTIGAGVTFTIDSDATLEIPKGKTLTFESGSTIVNNGEIRGNSEGAGKLVIESGVVGDLGKINDSVALTIDSDFEKTVYFHGDVDGTTYGENQRVEVDGDTVVTGDLTIEGVLHVAAGVTMTIQAGGSLTITNIYTSIIEGTLIIEASDGVESKLIIEGDAVLDVQGRLVVAGDLVVSSSKPLTVSGTADVAIESTGSVKGSFIVAEDANLTIEGAVDSDNSEFDVAGTLTLNSGVPSGSFAVKLNDGAVLDIQKVTLISGKTINVTDKGTEIYDSSKKKVAVGTDGKIDGVTIKGANTIELKGTVVLSDETTGVSDLGAQITGLKVSTAMKSSKITNTDTAYGALASKNYTKQVYTMSISGGVAVSASYEYDGSAASSPYIKTLTAAIALTGSTGAKITDVMSLGTNVELTLGKTVSIDAPVTLAYSAANPSAMTDAVNHEAQMSRVILSTTADMTVNAAIDASSASKDDTTVDNSASGSKLKIAAGGSISAKKTLTDAGLSAAMYSVTVKDPYGTSSTTFNYVTIDDALARMVDGTTTAVSLYGTQSVTESVTVPAKAVLTLESGSTLNIGAKTESIGVVLTLADGASIVDKGADKVKVNGTLKAEKSNSVPKTLKEDKIKSAVVSYQLNEKLKPVSNGWVKWTNLTTALNEASSGEEIVLNGPVVLPASSVVKEGVVLSFNGKTVVVPNGMTLTVDGTIDLTVENSKLAIANYYLPTGEAANAKSAGSLVLNGYVKYNGADQIVTASYDTTGYDVDLKPYKLNTDKFTVAGAYYELEDVLYISTVGNAAVVLPSIEGELVIMASSNTNAGESVDGATSESTFVSFSDVTFAGKDADNIATVRVLCPIEAEGVTLADARIVFGAEATTTTSPINASLEVSGAEGSAVLKGSFAAGFTVSSTSYGDDVSAVLGITGTIADYRDTVAGKDVSTQAVLGGTVYIIGYVALTVDKVEIAGTVSVVKAVGSDSATNSMLGGSTENEDSAASKATSVTISGTFEIKDNAEVSVEDRTTTSGSATTIVEEAKTVISGTLKVSKGTFTASLVTLSGSIDAETKDETSLKYLGHVVIGTLYLGTDANIESEKDVDKTIFTSTASASGDVKVEGYAVAAAGTVVPAGWSADDSSLNIVDRNRLVSTVLNGAMTVGADEYVTLYAPESNTKHIADFFIDATDSEFDGWMNADEVVAKRTASTGVPVSYTYAPDTATIGAPGWTSATAKIDYAIYALKITTDGGIGYVTVDGILMTAKDNTFTATGLKAGQHTIGISAASGYDVSKVTLINMDGTAVGSMTVTMSGKDVTTLSGGYYTSTYQLVGSETAAPSGGSSSSGGSDFSGIIDAIDKNTEAVKNQENGGSSGSSLTDILLIVLVILIVIMAILVAMRMMRS